jgi:tetratricopeptide (TPR) repeat protein
MDDFDDFVGRVDLVRSFCSLLNGAQFEGRIQFWRGDTGNGKSRLLDYLRSHCCKRLERDDWAYVSGLPDELFLANITKADAVVELPCLFVDLSYAGSDSSRSADAFSGLVRLRRSCRGASIRFPLFDFASALYLAGTTQTTSVSAPRPLPQGADLFGSVVDLVSGRAWGAFTSSFLKALDRYYGGATSVARLAKQVSPDIVADLQSLAPESLMARLPALLATDVNSLAARDVPCVVMIDGHDRLMNGSVALPDESTFFLDEWVRQLLAGLDLRKGVVALVAGTEWPRWAEAWRTPLSADALCARTVGPLSRSDGIRILEKKGVPKHRRPALLNLATVNGDYVSPLLLQLLASGGACADEGAVAVTRRSHVELVARFLRSVDGGFADAVRAMSAPRTFDKSLFDVVAEQLHLIRAPSVFARLTAQSFIQTDGGGSYRVHQLLRRALSETQDSVTLQAHLCLEELHKGGATVEDLVEALYHLSARDHVQAAHTWWRGFWVFLERGSLGFCRVLLSLLPELKFDSASTKITALELQAEYHLAVGDRDSAARCLAVAKATYREAVTGASADGEFEISVGNMYSRLAALDEESGNDPEQNHALAIAAYQRSLKSGGSPPLAEGNLASSMAELAIHRMHSGVVGVEVLRLLDVALSHYDKALAIEPKGTSFLLGRAHVLGAKGRLRYQNDDMDGALSLWSESLRGYWTCMQLFDGGMPYPKAVIGATSMLQALAEVQLAKSDLKSVREYGEKACELADWALSRSPNELLLLNGKAMGLRIFGRLAMKEERWQDAVERLNGALAVLSGITDIVTARHLFRGISLNNSRVSRVP